MDGWINELAEIKFSSVNVFLGYRLLNCQANFPEIWQEGFAQPDDTNSGSFILLTSPSRVWGPIKAC